MSVDKDKKKERRGGFYWFDEIPYVSVTTVLNVISKEFLMYWYGKQIYLAMVINPTISQKEALAAPYKITETAQDRGSKVHLIAESYEKTRKALDGLKEDIKPYATAFYDWVEENNMELVEHERTVVSKKYKFAGTLDLLARNKKTKKLYLIDLKTGKAIYPQAFLQLSAYKQGLLEEKVKVDKIAVLLLKENGKYKFEEGESNLDVFLAAKTLYEWQNKEKLIKIGYLI
jgi:hypothetical protein